MGRSSVRVREELILIPPSHSSATLAAAAFVTGMWSAHTLALVAAIGGVLVCIGLLAWIVFRKSEPQAPFGL